MVCAKDPPLTRVLLAGTFRAFHACLSLSRKNAEERALPRDTFPGTFAVAYDKAWLARSLPFARSQAAETRCIYAIHMHKGTRKSIMREQAARGALVRWRKNRSCHGTWLVVSQGHAESRLSGKPRPSVIPCCCGSSFLGSSAAFVCGAVQDPGAVGEIVALTWICLRSFWLVAMRALHSFLCIAF